MQAVFGIIVFLALLPTFIHPLAGLGTAAVVLPIGCVLYRLFAGKWPWK